MQYIQIAFIKNAIKTVFCTGLALGAASTLQAQEPAPAAAQTQQPAEKPVKPYGDNPNILHVWAYKAQEGVLNTAAKVGNAAERGIGKIKPSVDQAWDNTKDIAGNTVQKVDEGAQKATQGVNTKIQETKAALGGKPSQSAPIERRSLSEPSTSPSSYHSAPTAPSVNQAAPNTVPGSSGTATYPVTDL